MAKNATQTNARSAAASAAGDVRRQPAPRDAGNTDGGTTTEATAAPEVKAMPLIVIAPKNPKRAGTQAFDFFAKYPKGMTTLEATIANGVRMKDVKWDSDTQRRHILVGPEAEAFAEAIESNGAEGGLAYLRDTLKVNPITLIRLGLMPKPEKVVEAPAAEQAKADA